MRMMQTKRFFTIALVLLAVVSMMAQPVEMSNRNRVKYLNDKWLAQNGQDLWVVSLSLEWPQELAGDQMPELQAYLSSILFGQSSSSLREALEKLHRMTGKSILKMPTDEACSRHYLTCTSAILWQEKGLYISFLATVSETTGEGKSVRSDQRYFTFDLRNRQILSQDFVFNKDNLWGVYDSYPRMLFENNLAEHAVCQDEDMQKIDLRTIPKDFALLGSQMVFGLGGDSSHNNFSFESIYNLSAYSMLSRKFEKWLTGKTKSPKQVEAIAGPLPDSLFDITSSASPVYDVVDTIAAFSEGKNALYSYFRNNMQWPSEETETATDGRVVTSFVVEPDGRLTNFTVLRQVSPALDREAIRLLRGMPRWKPAKLNGQTVRSRVIQPIVFRLER